MSSDVVILTGPPGAGKSTTARALAKTYPRSVHLHTDDFWRYIASGAIPPYLPESDTQNQVVMRVIQQAAFTYAAGGFTTLIDGIVGPWMLGHFRDLGDGADLPRVHYVVLRPARDETVRRAQARTAEDALVEEEPIVSLWAQFSDLGALESHAIDTTDQETADTVRAVRDATASDRFLLDLVTVRDS
jgi:energy-coupling factor transporter ATP-binding protein EcfA2